jgi:hypothetical protein
MNITMPITIATCPKNVPKTCKAEGWLSVEGACPKIDNTIYNDTSDLISTNVFRGLMIFASS